MPDEENRDILNTLAKGAGITAFGMFFSKAITYFYRALVGRALGPEAYGQLAIGMMIVGIAATLSGDPVRNGLKKFIPEFREDNDKASIKGIVISALEINLIGSLLVGGTIFFSAEFIAVQIFDSTALIPIVQAFAIIAILERPYEIFIDTTIAFNTAKYRVISTNIVQNLIQLGATALFILLGMNVMGAVWGWAAGVLFTLPLAFYFLEKIGPVLTAKAESKHHRKKLFKFSYPLMLSGIVSIFLGHTDTAFLGYMMDETAVGFYNAAFPTAYLLLIPHQAIGQLSLTSLTETKAKGQDREETLKTAARWVFALTFPTFLIMSIFSSELITLLFGQQYATASTALIILAAGLLVNATVGRVGDLVQSSGYTKPVFYINAFNLILNIILNIILIPQLGIIGAAIATASSIAITNIYFAIKAYQIEKFHAFTKNMLKTIAASLTSITIVYLIFNTLFTDTPFWALIPAGMIFYTIYTLTFLKIGGLTEYDKEIVTSIGRKAGKEKLVQKTLNLLT